MTDSVALYRQFILAEQTAAAEKRPPLSPLEIYHEYLRRQRVQDTGQLGEIVDLEGYTENCLGLTGWTTGYDIAWRNFQRNILAPFSDRITTEEEIVEGQQAVVIRSRIEATHSGEFLGIPATGRRIAWDSIAIVHVKDGRFVGQWAQPDLYGIYQQITAPEV